MIKRLFDFVCSFFLIIIFSPAMILIAIFVKIDSQGPIIFLQKRVGRYGNPFYIYKFRTMYTNMYSSNSYKTLENDIRITKFGRVLRRTSLDEIPQLLNVLLGDMSLVGPRPNVYEQKANYTKEEWSIRNSVRPGITGLAQAKIRSASDPLERTRLDLLYIERHSLFFDIKIIFLTLKQLFIIKNVN